MPKPPLFAHVPTTSFSATAFPPDGSPTSGSDRGHAARACRPSAGEAAEALLELATGGTPQIADGGSAGVDPFEHPDAQRRFRVMHNVEELSARSTIPWEKWTVFLHPAQRELVERDFNGPARVAGSAGTGKTIVALHRAVHLARHHRERASCSPPSRSRWPTRCDLSFVGCFNEPRLGENIDVYALDCDRTAALRAQLGAPKIAADDDLRAALAEAAKAIGGHNSVSTFYGPNGPQVVDAWQLDIWDAYRDVAAQAARRDLPEGAERCCGRFLSRSARAWKRWANHVARNVSPAGRVLADGKRTPFRFRRGGRSTGSQRRAITVSRRAWNGRTE